MLFTARSRKSIRPNLSGSKDSKESNLGKKQQKIQNVSATDLKLRQAINLKYEKSKIKNYKCIKISTGLDYEKNDKNSNKSANSIDLPQYAPLATQRFINLKEYHKKSDTTPQNKQYLIKFRRSDYKKIIKTEQNNQSNSKLYSQFENKIFCQDFNANSLKNHSIFQSSFKQRKTLSGDKKEAEWKKLGFNYHSTSKNNNRNGSHKRAPSQQEQPKSRLYYFRKKNKSPQSKYI